MGDPQGQLWHLQGSTFPVGWPEEVCREEHGGLQLLRELVTNVLEAWHPGSREVECVEDIHGKNCGDRPPSSSIPNPSHRQLPPVTVSRLWSRCPDQ